MLETIREYGRERLAASEEVEAVQRAHAAYYLHLAEESSVVRRGPLENAWLEWCEREHENLRAALIFLLERAESTSVGASAELAGRLSILLDPSSINRPGADVPAH